MGTTEPPLRRNGLTRRELLRQGAMLGLGASALGALAACAPGGQAPQPAAPAAVAPTPSGPAGQITVAQSSDVLTLDPSKDTSPISLNVFKSIFDQLTDIRRDGSVGPLLATSWKSQDAITWEFTLVPGARFHSGEPVTVEDVLWTYQAIMADARSPVQAYTVAIEKIEKVDDRTVRFVTKYPYAPFPRQVSLISILPRATYERLGPEQFALRPVGSGPYKVVEWRKDDQLILETNAEYFGGAPAIRRVVFRPVPSESSRLAGLESGALDIVPLLPPSELQRLRRLSGIRVELVESNRNLYVGINTTTPPLDNLKLRQAIDVAIDRQAITRDLLSGLGKPVGQPVAAVTFGYDPAIPPSPYDPELARRLVRESGYRGEEILFQYPNNRYQFGNEVAQAVASALEAVGIRVKLEGMEYSAFFPLWTGKRLSGLHLFAFGPSIMDADLPLSSLYETGPSRGYWSSPEVDALIKQQRAAIDPTERQRLISRIWQISKENVPYVWLYTEIQAYGIRERVDWKPRADERLLMQEAKLRG
ncbi:MAG: hypothetical protein K6U89_18110 [Chloroflexi bacterium]|nr:hypothetical protein [Chloroflexota bacterium]